MSCMRRLVVSGAVASWHIRPPAGPRCRGGRLGQRDWQVNPSVVNGGSGVPRRRMANTLNNVPMPSEPASRSTSPADRSRVAGSALAPSCAGALEQSHAEQELALRHELRVETVRVGHLCKGGEIDMGGQVGFARIGKWIGVGDGRSAPATCRRTPAAIAIVDEKAAPPCVAIRSAIVSISAVRAGASSTIAPSGATPASSGSRARIRRASSGDESRSPASSSPTARSRHRPAVLHILPDRERRRTVRCRRSAVAGEAVRRCCVPIEAAVCFLPACACALLQSRAGLDQREARLGTQVRARAGRGCAACPSSASRGRGRSPR